MRLIIFATLINYVLVFGSAKHKEPFWGWAFHHPADLSAIAVAIFNALLVYVTYRLVVSTNRLWHAGERQRKSAEAIAALQRASSEKIGKAQVRAYVDILKAEIAFIGFPNSFYIGVPEAQPTIQIVARNTGQSPARNFVWNPTLQYVVLDAPRSREMGGNWQDILGVNIAAGQDHSDRGLIGEMPIIRYLASTGNISANSLMTRLRVQFEFEDVFDDRITGDAYFFGYVSKTPGLQTELGPTLWAGSLTRMHRPNDWPPANNHG
jgi:hypothetical protein